MGTTLKVAPNPKNNYKYKTLILQCFKTCSKMLQVTVRQLEVNEVAWKPTTKNAGLSKTKMLLVQFPGSSTNISHLQKNQKHQGEYVQKFSEVFYRLPESKWLLMLHAHETPKRIKNIWLASEITGVYIYKKWSCLRHKKCQNILIYNFLLEHNWKK